MKLATNIQHMRRVCSAEKVFKVRGQRSRSYVFNSANAMMAEACILMVCCQGSLVVSQC